MLRGLGHSQEDIDTAERLMHEHTRDHTQKRADEELNVHVAEDDSVADVLKELGEFELAMWEAYAGAWTDRRDESRKEMKEAWEMGSGNPYAYSTWEEQWETEEGYKHKGPPELRLYRRGATDKPVQSWTTDPEGANTSVLTSGTRIEPDRESTLSKLVSEGMLPVMGIAISHGYSGEGEVLMIRFKSRSAQDAPQDSALSTHPPFPGPRPSASSAALRPIQDTVARLNRELDRLGQVVGARTTAAGPVVARVIAEEELRHRRGFTAALRSASAIDASIIFSARDVGPQLRVAAEQFASLIKGVTDDMVRRVATAVLDHARKGTRKDTLARNLQKILQSSAKRSRFIARDQTASLNASLNKIRQRQLGVRKYVWSTSMDERVRPLHAHREGQTFSWARPPSDGHPGEPINCRCVARAVIEPFDLGDARPRVGTSDWLSWFKPSEHPRDPEGKFAEKGGSDPLLERWQRKEAPHVVTDDELAQHPELRLLGPGAKDWFKQICTVPVKDFISKMGVPEGTQIRVSSTGFTLTGGAKGTGMSFKFQTDIPEDKSTGILCGREFYPAEKRVEHDIFFLGLDEQGKGRAKKILADQVELYHDLGYEKITLEANVDLGAYAWAKYGFTPTQEEWDDGAIKGHLRQRLKMMKGLTDEHKAAIQKLIASDDPQSIWALSDITARVQVRMEGVAPEIAAGKALLINQTWAGELKFSDRTAMERLSGYITAKR